MKLTEKALIFAIKAHDNQLRKYTEEPYIIHPIGVAGLVRSIGASQEAIAAAYLHDVIEDTYATYEQIKLEFGEYVADLVQLLTDPPTIPGGPNRAERKRATRLRYLLAQGQLAIDAHTIKAADCIHNAPSIKTFDPNFWEVYRKEIIQLLGVLVHADEKLVGLLKDTLNGM